MEQQILNELSSIHTLLEYLVVAVSIGMAIWGAKSITILVRHFRRLKSDVWRDLANHLYSKGDYSELLKESKKRLEKEPRGADHLYWKAKAEKELKEFDSLRETVAQLDMTCPAWKEEWMNEYLTRSSAS